MARGRGIFSLATDKISNKFFFFNGLKDRRFERNRRVKGGEGKMGEMGREKRKTYKNHHVTEDGVKASLFPKNTCLQKGCFVVYLDVPLIAQSAPRFYRALIEALSSASFHPSSFPFCSVLVFYTFCR